eukprot:TRINITY_DN1068_c0_g1_i1.p1 TRINITY_DN1068_c0_g1~~TRINITY_DN1068_c0_g1_i1.p1  ORF type:complete len:176 (+),score=50.20 TRINITY_DN1068_c0_g1_i1:53-529(+)
MAESAGKSREVSLTSLTPEQLNNFRQQLETEVETLTSSYSQLKVARDRFSDSKKSVEFMKTMSEGQDVLVPLTSSLYVPGKAKGVDKVLIDIGTGYYVSKEIEPAAEFFGRKMQFVKDNMDKLQGTITSKRQNFEAVSMILQSKIQQAERAGAAGASS